MIKEKTNLGFLLDIPQGSRKKKFIKKHQVLFAAVLENVIDYEWIQSYFEGSIPLRAVIENLSVYEDFEDYLWYIHNLDDLELVVRKFVLFDMHDKELMS